MFWSQEIYLKPQIPYEDFRGAVESKLEVLYHSIHFAILLLILASTHAKSEHLNFVPN